MQTGGRFFKNQPPMDLFGKNQPTVISTTPLQ